MSTQTEDKKVETTTPDASQEQKQSDEKKADDQADQADDQIDDQDNIQIDHAVEAAKLRTQISQAEYNIQQLKKDKKQQPKETGDEPVIEDVDTKIAKGFSVIQEQLAANTLASSLASLSSDPAEREHIKAVYDLKIQKSGFTPEAILSDLEDAKLLANKRKILRENFEIKRAIIEQNNLTNAGGGSNQDRKETEVQPTVKVTEAEIALLARRGLKPSDVKVYSSTATKR